MNVRLSIVGLALVLASTALADEVAAPESSRARLHVTAYADGMALVQETRSVLLPAGSSSVVVEGPCPACLRPASSSPPTTPR